MITKYSDISAPPVFNPKDWTNKLDDAEQTGYINGYAAADKNRPYRILLSFGVGTLIGFLVGFFSFYK